MSKLTRKMNYIDRSKAVIMKLEGKSVEEISTKLNRPAAQVRVTLNNELPKLAKFNDRLGEVVEKNNMLLFHIDEKLLNKLNDDDVKIKDLIALKDLVVKQNRLLQGQSTENVSNVVINFDSDVERKKESFTINDEENLGVV